jgi:hypothetical protein
MRELETSAVGDCEFRWMERYGMSYKLSGGFGVRFLIYIPIGLFAVTNRDFYDISQIYS